MEEPGLRPWEGAEPSWEAGEGTKFAGFAAVREDWALPWGWAASSSHGSSVFQW